MNYRTKVGGQYLSRHAAPCCWCGELTDHYRRTILNIDSGIYHRRLHLCDGRCADHHARALQAVGTFLRFV